MGNSELESACNNARLDLIRNRENLRRRCGKPGVQLVSVHLQRDGFIGAAAEEPPDIIGGKLWQSQLLVPNDKVYRSRIARKPARIKQACVGCAMANGVSQAQSQTCEPYRASPAGHQV